LEVARAFEVEFGRPITRQSVQHYDPTTVQGEHGKLPDVVVKEFWAARERFIPIANRAYRLQMLQRLEDHPDFQDNTRLKLDLVELAEKITGDYYTNKRELSGPDGGRIPIDLFSSSLDKIYGDDGADSGPAEPKAE
jgi:hypothetical protein